MSLGPGPTRGTPHVIGRGRPGNGDIPHIPHRRRYFPAVCSSEERLPLVLDVHPFNVRQINRHLDPRIPVVACHDAVA